MFRCPEVSTSWLVHLPRRRAASLIICGAPVEVKSFSSCWSQNAGLLPSMCVGKRKAGAGMSLILCAGSRTATASSPKAIEARLRVRINFEDAFQAVGGYLAWPFERRFPAKSIAGTRKVEACTFSCEEHPHFPFTYMTPPAAAGRHSPIQAGREGKR